jgi:hypothetical protein
MKYFLLILLPLLVSAEAYTDRFVFDMPEVHAQHIKLLALMYDAHSQQDYYAMGTLCHRGINLRTAGALWHYNLACALALQDNPEEAIDTLKQALKLGFDDLQHLRKDPDLANLRKRDEYRKLVENTQRNLADPAYTNSAVRRIMALPPTTDASIEQSATNSIWSFNTGKFHTFVILAKPEKNNQPLKKRDSDNPIMIYANRDNNTTTPDLTQRPGVLRLTYSEDVVKRRLNLGLPNTIFIDGANGCTVPVAGNSSLGFVKSAYWRCQPRALFNDPKMIGSQMAMLLSNQLFCYPTYRDYTIGQYDLFPANTPYYIAVSGGSGSENVFTEAVIDAFCAMPAKTRAYLTRDGKVMTTILALLRKSQHGVVTISDYLSGKAHPAAFQVESLDKEHLLASASTLSTNEIPPLAMLQFEDQSNLNPALDMPGMIYNESLFTTPLAVARVFRAFPQKRIYRVKVLSDDEDAPICAVLLQGESAKIRLEADPQERHAWLIEVMHHTPFKTTVSQGSSISTMRVDIGFFAGEPENLSLPAILSIYFPGNERRSYDAQGRLLSIDYRRSTTPYTDPLLSIKRDWQDVFKHDRTGRIIGWQRFRARREPQPFTAYGDLVTAYDQQGRAVKARRIQYIKRFHGNESDGYDSLPTLAQVDDNIEVRYTYESDDDLIGKPEAKITLLQAPPDEMAETLE